MAPTVTAPKHATRPRPRVLVVDDEPDMRRLVKDVVGSQVPCDLLFAADLKAATKIIETEPLELALIDLHLPDGDGMGLLGALRDKRPGATAIVMTGQANVGNAVTAIRAGVSDFLPKPFSATSLVERISKALERQRQSAKVEKRLGRLRDAVRRLNVSRRMVTKKVDLLCNDLVSAYGELARQVDDVRHQESFRKLMGEAKDLEQMLCHAMDWLLRHCGYSNVAVWLAADENDFQLGAYMKYTIAGDQLVTESMRAGILQQILREGVLHLSADEAHRRLTDAELNYIAGQTFLGANCTYLGESLAAVVMFRDDKCPFTADDAAMLKAIGPIFATALAGIVRRSAGEDGDDDGGDTLWDEDGKDPKNDKRDRRSDADWWKRGEAPPF